MDTPPTTFVQSSNRRMAARSKPRTPLQEHTSSQTNEQSARIGRDARREQDEVDMFSATPFPTKPQHILLPSTLRKQQSSRDEENIFPAFFSRSQQSTTSRPTTSGQNDLLEEPRGRRAPVLQLKRSVTTLRDMYEAQADRSRPSTAASFSQRPGTASSRLRSVSSSDGLAGRSAWEQLNKVSADDMALLPSLSRGSLERLASESSFASRVEQGHFLTSSPNYRIYGTSSPKIPVFRDNIASTSDDYHQSSSSGNAQTSSSSPNFVRLGRSSSIAETLATQQSSSSPNFVKLGTSSPGLRLSSSPTPSVASEGSRKRKRSEREAESSFVARAQPFSSSPPYVVLGVSSSQPSLQSPSSIMPSSPPRPESVQSHSIATSSPVYRLPNTLQQTPSSTTSSSTHASLQAALTSSPMPPIQYPVIRAPAPAATILSVPKRNTRNTSSESAAPWSSRLSPVPSEWDEGLSRSGSNASRAMRDLGHELQRSDSIEPEHTGNESQVRIIPLTEDDHLHEATDELRALPRTRGLAYRSPPIVPARTNSLFGTISSSSGSQSQSRLNSLRTSVDTRLNSMRSYTHSRQNSFMSSNIRPGSSDSQSLQVIVPTWARRYYSGVYRDSFQYLYPSQTNSASKLPASLYNDTNKSSTLLPGMTQLQPEVSRESRRRSWNSIKGSLRSSMLEYVPSVLLPRGRQRLDARKSHMTIGCGPLVSHPVHPEIGNSSTDLHHATIRRVSDNLPSVDPRAHWAGITEEQINMMQYQNSTPYHSSQQVNRQSGDSESVYYDAVSGDIQRRSRLIDIPHLHHDRRLNTGSSKSRGFGYPFNQKSRYQAPSVYDAATRASWLHMDLRDAQVTCFIVGFLFPPGWFIGAFLPLPPRPESYNDIEKAMYEHQNDQSGEWQDLDVVARLRLERHIKGVEELKWQNARWWKRMNKWMCSVGVVVFVLAIVLAVIGTRNRW